MRAVVTAAALLAMAGLGGGLVFAIRGTPVQAAPSLEAAKPIFVTLEPVTVNLQSDTKARFLHLGITLKVTDEKSQSRVTEAIPELRSRLLMLLSNRDPATLLAPADKAKLAEEIRADLNRPAAAGSPPYGVTGVAFNAFVVQ